MDRKQIVLRHLIHRDQGQVALIFPKDRELIELVKSIGAKWSQTRKCWYMANKRENVTKLFAEARGRVWIEGKEFFGQKDQQQEKRKSGKALPVQKKLNEEQQKAVKWVKELLQSKGYSHSTIRTYSSLLETFFTW